MSNEQAIADFQAAREQYLARHFAQARTTMQRYRQTIDYRQFKQQDNRTETKPEISVIIVGYGTGPELLECIHSVSAQQGARFEIILVDNGKNEAVHPELAQLPICWISPPINLLPSEGRNLGAHFANSDILVFLDDDALMAPGYLAAVKQRAQANEYLALRGRIQPKSPTATAQPKHYDLGETEQPSEFNLEGNMVIRRSLFQKLGRFDPLMFGHEGKALTQQWRLHFPGKDILYCPDLVIRHDWAEAENLTNKRERQALGKDYLDQLKEHVLNAGVTIILCAGDKLAEAKTFLEGLAKHNSYKPIEVLIWAKDSQQAVGLTRPYMAKFFARVLPASTQTFSNVARACRYDNCLIVGLPTQIQADALPVWLQQKRSDLKTVLVGTKTEIEKLGETKLSSELEQLANKMGKNLSGKAATTATAQPEAQLAAKPQPKEDPKSAPNTPQAEKVKAKPAPANTPQLSPEIAGNIQQTEAKIIQLEIQLTQTGQSIAKLEARYLPLPDDSMEKQDLKDDLEEQVLASCRLLIDLKDAQDNLQELRIRNIYFA
jgi:GT2 family glycosyltransferase